MILNHPEVFETVANLILNTLNRHRGNEVKTARELNISRGSLRKYLKQILGGYNETIEYL